MKTKFNYKAFFTAIKDKTISDKDKDSVYRYLIENDIYFIVRYLLGIESAEHQFVYDRAMEVQRNNIYTIDLWARAHFKSTLITIALTLQELIKYPKISTCIFSHTSPIAHAFLKSIKNILKTDDFLHRLYPDIIPEPTSNLLSDERIIMMSNIKRKEPSVMASGLVDGQPTSMHFDRRIYDDIVVPESVSTPDQINKLEERFRLSHNLASHIDIARVIGTRYHYSDLFEKLLNEKPWVPRIYPAEDKDGEPVFLTKEQLEDKRNKMGSYIYNCQMMLDPQSDQTRIFKEENINYYTEMPKNISKKMILVDPAISQNKLSACYFVSMVVGVAGDRLYVLDYFSGIGVLPKTQADVIYNQKLKHNAKIGIELVGYQQALKYAVEDKFKNEGMPVPTIEELKPLRAKADRIIGLQPYFENNQIYIRPEHKELIAEITQYPYYKYKDHIDVLAYFPQYLKLKHERFDKSSNMSNNIRRNISGNNINRIKRGKIRWQREM